MTDEEALAAIQSILRQTGDYSGEMDSRFGPKSRAGLEQLVKRYDSSRATAPPAGDSGAGDVPAGFSVDARSEANIATLHPKVQPLARHLVALAAGSNIKIIVTSATRTYAQQDALYEQGRTKPGKIVTNARAGYSNHNHGLAFDVTVFTGASPIWEGAQYKAVGLLGKSLGLTWGGDWQSIQDEPHFELRPDWARGESEASMLAELRRRHESGADVFG